MFCTTECIEPLQPHGQYQSHSFFTPDQHLSFTWECRSGETEPHDQCSPHNHGIPIQPPPQNTATGKQLPHDLMCIQRQLFLRSLLFHRDHTLNPKVLKNSCVSFWGLFCVTLFSLSCRTFIVEVQCVCKIMAKWRMFEGTTVACNHPLSLQDTLVLRSCVFLLLQTNTAILLELSWSAHVVAASQICSDHIHTQWSFSNLPHREPWKPQSYLDDLIIIFAPTPTREHLNRHLVEWHRSMDRLWGGGLGGCQCSTWKGKCLLSPHNADLCVM